MRAYLTSVIAAILWCVCSSCGADIGEIERKANVTTTNTMRSVPFLKAAAEIFPTHKRFLYYYTSAKRTPVLEFTAYFGDRYTFTLQYEVTIDRGSDTITTSKLKDAVLDEVESVEFDGGWHIRYRKGWRPTEEQLSKLFEAKADFSKIGIQIDPSPVENFSKWVAAALAPPSK